MKKILIFLLVFNVSIWSVIVFEENNNKNNLLEVSFLNVGQGDSIFIKTPSGKTVLVDSGSGAQVLRSLGKVFYGNKLDLIIASHYDKDHIGGMESIFSRYDVTGFVDGSEQKKFSQKLTSIHSGSKIDFGDGVILEVLFPQIKNNGNENHDSVVLKLLYGKTSFLLTGDIPVETENYLLKEFGDELNSDVLKVAHHGSKNSSGENFLNLVSPEYAVISVGENNFYGHPDPLVLNRLEKVGAKIFLTKEKNAITFLSDGNSLKLE